MDPTDDTLAQAPPRVDTLGHLVSNVADGVEQMATLHLELLKAEVTRDLKVLAREASPLAVGVPLIAVGYLLTCVTVAVALASWIGLPLGFAVVSAVNLLAGGLAIKTSLAKLRDRHGIHPTVARELDRSAHSIAAALRDPPDVHHAR